MIEVKLKVSDKVIIETLSRCGIANHREKILYPSCYLFVQDDKYYVAHFKEMFIILKSDSYFNFTDSDKERLNAIVYNFSNWELIEKIDDSLIDPHKIKIDIINFTDKKNWKISHKIKYFYNQNDK